MFCAHGTDKQTLGEPANLLETIINTPGRVAGLITFANETGFVFDD